MQHMLATVENIMQQCRTGRYLSLLNGVLPLRKSILSSLDLINKA